VTRTCKLRRLGRVDYGDALRMQEGMVRLRAEGRIDDTLLFVEHPHVITAGSASKREHVLLSADELDARGIEYFETGRGGDVTYHGPGQVVGYPILQLEGERRDAHRYLRDLEEVLIRTLGDFSIKARRHERHTGVWVDHDGERKIAAIGVRLSRWVTSHGFALNVDPDLSFFDTIVPCGIRDAGVTSMSAVTGKSYEVEAVEEALAGRFAELFEVQLVVPEVGA